MGGGLFTFIGEVRRQWGNDRCLFGNIDSEHLLTLGDEAMITAEVQRQYKAAGRDAPFVLSTGSPIPNDLDPAALDIMIGAGRAL